jgi:hypothetical protein
MIKIAVHKHDPSKEINSQLQDNFFKDDSFFVELCWNRIINQRTHSYIKELNEDMITMNVYDANTTGLVPFEIIEENDTSKVHEYDVFVIHPSAIARLDTKEIEQLVNSRDTRVVLDYLFEAEIDTYMPLINTVREYIGQPDNWMLLVGGDIVSNDENLLQNFRDKTGVDLGFFNYFRINEACIGKQKLRDRLYSVDTLQDNFRSPKTKEFLCLNLKPRFHRLAVVKHFIDHGLLNRNLITARWDYQKEYKRKDEFHDVRNSHGFFDELESGEYSERLRRECNFYNETPETLLQFIKENPTEITIPSLQENSLNLQNDDRSFVNDLYKDSYYSLVTETYYDDEFINQLPDMPEEYNHKLKRAFITEKTYKPLMYGHPFMVIGNVNTNTILKEQGFEMFEDEFEWKYDTLNDKNRYNAILSNVTTFDYERFDYHTLGKIIHNFHNFYDNRKLLEQMDMLWKIIK